MSAEQVPMTPYEPPGAAAPLLVIVLALQFPLVQFTKTVVDHATTVRDASGTVHFISDGQAAQLLQLALSLLATGVATHLVIRSLRGRQFTLSSWSLLAAALLVAEILRGQAGPVGLLYAGLVLVVLLGAGVMRIGPRTIASVGHVAGGVAVTSLLFPLIDPDRGWAPCRADKCTLAGGLLRGYFPQENVLGLFLATLLPAVAYIRSVALRRTTVTLVLVCALLTGSRTAQAASVLGLLAYVLLRRRAHPDRMHGDATKILALFPLVTFAASTVMLFTLSDMALTGRGLIFRIVREGLARQPLLGPGRGALEDAYYTGVANWYLSHEHGQAAYVLGQAGLLGGLLMVAALASIIRAAWTARSALPAVFALVPSLGFLTEPTWEVGLRAAYVTSLVLTVCLVSHALRGEPLPVPPPAAERRRELSSRATLAPASANPRSHPGWT